MLLIDQISQTNQIIKSDNLSYNYLDTSPILSLAIYTRIDFTEEKGKLLLKCLENKTIKVLDISKIYL